MQSDSSISARPCHGFGGKLDQPCGGPAFPSIHHALGARQGAELRSGLWSSLMSTSVVVQVHVLTAAAFLAAGVMIAVGSRSRMVPAR